MATMRQRSDSRRAGEPTPVEEEMVIFESEIAPFEEQHGEQAKDVGESSQSKGLKYSNYGGSPPTSPKSVSNQRLLERRAQRQILVVGILGFLIYLLPDGALTEASEDLKVSGVPLSLFGDLRTALSAFVLVIYCLYLRGISAMVATIRASGGDFGFMLNPIGIQPFGEKYSFNEMFSYIDLGWGLGRRVVAAIFRMSRWAIALTQMSVVLLLFVFVVLGSAMFLAYEVYSVGIVEWKSAPLPVLGVLLIGLSVFSTIQFLTVCLPPQKESEKEFIKRRVRELWGEIEKVVDEKVFREINEMACRDKAKIVLGVDDVQGLSSILTSIFGRVPDSMRALDSYSKRCSVLLILAGLWLRENSERNPEYKNQSIWSIIDKLREESGLDVGSRVKFHPYSFDPREKFPDECRSIKSEFQFSADCLQSSVSFLIKFCFDEYSEIQRLAGSVSPDLRRAFNAIGGYKDRLTVLEARVRTH